MSGNANQTGNANPTNCPANEDLRSTVARALSQADWVQLGDELNQQGYLQLDNVLSSSVCATLRALYGDQPGRFRSTIKMDRFNFGRGEYKYFAYPLPVDVSDLRDAFYRPLSQIANQWCELLGKPATWPTTLSELTNQCHQAGQTRPTPLLLRYGEDDYNCLHQDLYGDIHFPLQVVFMLSDHSCHFDGGELVLVEQRPRMQSRPIVLNPPLGSAVVLPVRERPVRGTRGFYQVQMRHGVSRVRRGDRQTMGLIFHDAR